MSFARSDCTVRDDGNNNIIKDDKKNNRRIRYWVVDNPATVSYVDDIVSLEYKSPTVIIMPTDRHTPRIGKLPTRAYIRVYVIVLKIPPAVQGTGPTNTDGRTFLPLFFSGLLLLHFFFFFAVRFTKIVRYYLPTTIVIASRDGAKTSRDYNNRIRISTVVHFAIRILFIVFAECTTINFAGGKPNTFGPSATIVFYFFVCKLRMARTRCPPGIPCRPGIRIWRRSIHLS